ncbi:hypothetical protein SAMN04489727_1696 [Amycolatopsis tolypomycina]|uniref:Uncharacterized protein n=1 Tax=Amycolatopsis tolypomycina TaxID=208445 RepID=A0A1H4JAA2_9PSEU|nr:hypothetical protein [Amycolatopsis tolypomycina]SEB43249.1 hypothetical protein SAMN04489727_1696 [Amycolatopsis tolypomycina]
MTAEDGGRHLSAVPAPGVPASPKPAPPRGGPYTRNPLLNYKLGPDVDCVCPACHWVKAHQGNEYCPYHVAWRDMKAFAVDRVGDLDGSPLVYPTDEPKYSRGQKIWFQGKLPVRVTQRYWGTDGRWRYVCKALTGGSAVDSYEHLFTPEFDARWGT